MKESSLLLDQLQAYAPEAGEWLNDEVMHILRAADECGAYDATMPALPDLAGTLIEWQVPLPMVLATLWSVTNPRNQCPKLQRVMSNHVHEPTVLQLVKLCHLLQSELAHQRSDDEHRSALVQLQRNLWRTPWRHGLLVLLIAILYHTMRKAAETHAADVHGLALQAEILYIPLCELLGLWTIRRMLHNLVFQMRSEERFREIERDMAEWRPRIDLFVEEARMLLQRQGGASFREQGRIEVTEVLPYKLDRLRRTARNRLDVHDMVLFTLLLPTDNACYACAHTLQQTYGVGKTFRDHVIEPKPNGYTALRMRLGRRTGIGPIAVALCTPAAHARNLWGEVYLWRTHTTDLFAEAQMAMLPPIGSLFTFQHTGHMVMLAAGAAVRDLAVKLTNDAHPTADRVIIHGVVDAGTMDTELHNGDIVEFVNLAPHAHHRTARPHASPAQPRARDTGPQKPSLEELHTVQEALVIPAEFAHHAIHWCGHCKPFPTDAVVAYNTGEQQLTLHTSMCKMLHGVDRHQLVAMAWQRTKQRPAKFIVDVEVWDDRGRLMVLASTIAEYGISISESITQSRTNGTAHLVFSLQDGKETTAKKICKKMQQNWWVSDAGYRPAKMYELLSESFPGEGSGAQRSATASAPAAVMHMAQESTTTQLFNPYTPTPSLGSSLIFYGRAQDLQDIDDTINSMGPCRSVALWGQQRIGKSSLLNHMEDRLSAPIRNQIPIKLSLSQWSGQSPSLTIIDWLGEQIASTLRQKLRELGHDASFLPWHADHARGDTPVETLIHYIITLQNWLGQRRLIIMLDEFQALVGIDHSDQVLHAMRHVMERNDSIFLLAGWGMQFRRICDTALGAGVLMRVQTVDVLRRDAAEQLVCEPVKRFMTYTPEVVQHIVTLTAGNPYFIHLLCHEIVDRRARAAVTVIESDFFQHVVDDFISTNAQAFNHLIELDDLSPIVCKRVLQEIAWQETRTQTAVAESSLVRLKKKGDSAEDIRAIVDAFCETSVLARNDGGVRLRLPLLRMWLTQTQERS